MFTSCVGLNGLGAESYRSWKVLKGVECTVGFGLFVGLADKKQKYKISPAVSF